MFCCGDVPWRYEPASTKNSVAQSGISGFPGARRRLGPTLDQNAAGGGTNSGNSSQFNNTGGNALKKMDGASNHNDNATHSNTNEKLISVIVPNGVLPGQKIHINIDGGINSRMIAATVPEGVQSGSTFLVSVPEKTQPLHGNGTCAPPTVKGESKHTGDPNMSQSNTNTSFVLAQTGISDPSFVNSLKPHRASEHVFTTETITESPQSFSNQDFSTKTKFLRVEVPPGTKAGSTLHIRVPGEDQMVAAVVPNGVKCFQVAYEPSTTVTTSNKVSKQEIQKLTEAPSQKPALVLVKVPPGTPPGTTLHVQIPGENRMIAATVPRGDLSEFYVECPVSLHPKIPTQQKDQDTSLLNNHNSQRLRNEQRNSSESSPFGTAAVVAAPIIAGAASLVGLSMLHHNNNSNGQS